MAARGAAVHLPQTELTPGRLADLLQRPDARRAAGDGRRKARALARPHAAARVADEIEATLREAAAAA